MRQLIVEFVRPMLPKHEKQRFCQCYGVCTRFVCETNNFICGCMVQNSFAEQQTDLVRDEKHCLKTKDLFVLWFLKNWTIYLLCCFFA